MEKKLFRLKVARSDFEELRQLCFDRHPREAGAFALAGVSSGERETTLLVRRSVPVPASEFIVQEQHRLELSARATNGLAALCEVNKVGAIVCHSHPYDVGYSPTDDLGERRLAKALFAFLPDKMPLGSLLFLPDRVVGRVWIRDHQQPVELAEVIVVGGHLQCFRIAPGPGPDPIPAVYDRQARAFGVEGQAVISAAKVAVIGVGGTGSPTAEQLVRLGVNDLVLVDPKIFHDSNLTRVYGTFDSDIGSGEHKVELVAKHLRRIRSGIRVRTLPETVVSADVARHLLDRDVIFLCTDDHWGRSVVNELSYQYLVPVINLGSRVAAKNGTITGAVGVVDLLYPDSPCLWCSQFLRSERIAAESMPPAERRHLSAEGYVEGLDTPAPSVVSINTVVSGLAVTLFIHMLTGFMGELGAVRRLSYDAMEGRVRRQQTRRAENCVCAKVRGRGELRALGAA